MASFARFEAVARWRTTPRPPVSIGFILLFPGRENLTLFIAHPKSKGKVFNIPLTKYAQWRQSVRLVPALHDGNTAPAEQLLQAVWYHQRLLRDELKTEDGQRVRVLHPGFWNHEAGPDFKQAVVQFGAEMPVIGDVEVDLLPTGWKSHGHATNPNYTNVVLHVVWRGGGASPLPTLALAPVLDAPVEELQHWLDGDNRRDMPDPVLGKCNGPLRDLKPETRRDVLRQAAQVRLQAKAAQFQSRARQVGWEQALWEGLFRALGYKQNVWPLQRLAELKPQLQAGASTTLALQTRLLGIGGLLPSQLSHRQTVTDEYLRRLWDQWWRERETFTDITLPRSVWRFNGIRPANHPQRRLALAAHWLTHEDLPARLENWFAKTVTEAQLPDSLLEILQAPQDEYWSWHWTLNSARCAAPQPLLGLQRVSDLAINVILPWLWVRAVAGHNEHLRQKAEQRYFAWPAAEDNIVLRHARQRLWSSASARQFKTAAEQQGLLQIVRDFCERSNALCEHCRFPELVRGIAG